MKKPNEIILGALVVLLAIGIFFRPKKMLPPVPIPVSDASKPPLPRVVEQLAPKDLLSMMTQPKPVSPPSTGEPLPFAKVGFLERDAILGNYILGSSG